MRGQAQLIGLNLRVLDPKRFSLDIPILKQDLEGWNIIYHNTVLVLAICFMFLSIAIEPVYCDSDGLAIIAVRTAAVQLPWGLGPVGHVGVGFQNQDGTWTIGGVENTGGAPVVLPGADNRIGIVPVVGAIYDNGGWVESYKTLLEVSVKFHSLGYDVIKVIRVGDTQPKRASDVINNFPTRGYDVVTNNCLKATIDVLTAYGITDLPIQLMHQAPTDYYTNVMGEEYFWDADKKKYTDLATGMPLADNPSMFQEKPTSTPASGVIQQPIDLEKVTLILYVHDGDRNGPSIPGAQVTGQDGSGNSFQQTTDSNGYVTIIGDKGTWSFIALAEGYETNIWSLDITEKCTKRATLTKSAAPSQEQMVTVTLYVNEGNEDGPIISGAQVEGQDGLGKSFKGTAYSQGIDIKGYPGTWSFAVSANSYETNSWTEPINDYCTRNAFLRKIMYQEPVQANYEPANQPSSQVTLTLYVHDGSASGPKIPWAKVTGKDGSGNSFKKNTKSNGYVTIEGNPGTWSFRASADGYETNNWDQKISKTSTKHAFLEESATSATSQGSESSVVGKWAFHFQRESWESSSDKVTRDPDSEEWDSMIQFHSDGTFTESESDWLLTGEWIQIGDTIRLQGKGDFHFEPDHYVTTTEESESLDGRIEGSIMSGKGSSLCHLTTTGDEATDYNSYSADISQTYSWSASRVD